MARTLVAHEDAVLEAEASNPSQAKARELGVDPLWAPDRKAQTAAAFAAAPRFLLLDFRRAGTLGPVGPWAQEAVLNDHAPATEAAAARSMLLAQGADVAAKLSHAVGKLEASLRLPRYILLSWCGELLTAG